jgi:hypothetical protein
MIPRKKKICKGCGQETILFSRGLCQPCWRKQRSLAEVSSFAREAILNTPNSPVEPPKRANKGITNKSNTSVPFRTKKRSQQEKIYHGIIQEMDREKSIKCFFCGGKMNHPEEHHHIDGRDGERLTDTHNIVHVHATCHYWYHNRSVHSISWYVDWLERIQESHPDLYNKELIKYNK